MKIILVDSRNRKTFVDKISGSITVKELIKMLYEKNLVKTTEIELIFNGMILTEDSKLEDYHISEGSLINYSGIFRAG